VQVPLRRLDDLVGPDAARIRFMKIDVEGHEGPVVRGALEILRRSQPALLIEVSGDPDAPASSAARLVQELAALGYRAYWWDGVAAGPAAGRPGGGLLLPAGASSESDRSSRRLGGAEGASMKLSIVIPVYNEEATVSAVWSTWCGPLTWDP
jgi:hypothetical protein